MKSSREYADMARNYAEAFLPSMVSTIEDPDAYWAKKGQEIRAAVESAEQETPALTSPDDTYAQRVAALKAARKRGEELVLADLVFLPPEPGTENNRQAGFEMVGWDELERDDDQPQMEP